MPRPGIPLPGTRLASFLAIAVALAAVSGAVVLVLSHREAPLITGTPKVDGTDFYMFRSYEPGRDGYVTLVAELPAAAGRLRRPELLHARSQRAVRDPHRQRRRRARGHHVPVPLPDTQRTTTSCIGSAATHSVADPARAERAAAIAARRYREPERHETYTVDVVRGGVARAAQLTNAASGSHVFDKPVDNIGTKTIPTTSPMPRATSTTSAIPGCAAGRVFVGQRKDPFVVNLGETFDLVNIKDPAVERRLRRRDGRRSRDKNVTSLILEVPIACLTEGQGTVIGGWTTASCRQAR